LLIRVYAKLLRECFAIFTCRAITAANPTLQCSNTVMVDHGFNVKCLCWRDCHKLNREAVDIVSLLRAATHCRHHFVFVGIYQQYILAVFFVSYW